MQQPHLIIPALGPLYRALGPLTEQLIRATAGGSLAIHGYPIVFGSKATAAKFLESVGFQDGLFRAYIAGTVEFVCGLCLALGLFTRLVAGPIIGFLVIAIITYHLAIRIRVGEARHQISAVLVDRGIALSGARRLAMVARRADRPRGVML